MIHTDAFMDVCHGVACHQHTNGNLTRSSCYAVPVTIDCVGGKIGDDDDDDGYNDSIAGDKAINAFERTGAGR